MILEACGQNIIIRYLTGDVCTCGYLSYRLVQSVSNVREIIVWNLVWNCLSGPQVTFFASIMCLEARRQAARRVDCICCITSSAPPDQGCCFGACGSGAPAERPSTRVMTWLGEKFSTPVARAVIIPLWFALLAAGIYGTSQMRVDADVNDFIPAGSYLKDWIAIAQTQFGTTGISVNLYWVSTAEVRLDASCAPLCGRRTCGKTACACFSVHGSKHVVTAVAVPCDGSHDGTL